MTYDPSSNNPKSSGASASTTPPSGGPSAAAAAKDKAAETAQDAAGRAQQVASTAKGEVGNTAQVAVDEVKHVAAEVSTQAKDLFSGAAGQLNEQAGTQKQRLAELLRSFTDELQQMADSSKSSGPATQLVRQIASRAESLHAQIDGHEPSALLDQGRSYARRSPGSFLLGSLAAGIVAGRLTRGARATPEDSSTPPAQVTSVPRTPALPPAAAGGTGLTGPGYGEQTFEPSVYEPGVTGTDRPFRSGPA